MSMVFRKHFCHVLLTASPTEAATLTALVDERYAVVRKEVAFARTSGNPMDRRLNFAAYFLAFIQILEEAGKDFPTIRELSLRVAHNYVKPKNRFQAWMKRLPPRLISLPFMRTLLVAFDRRIRKAGHPDGFVARLVTDKSQTYGFGYGVDILECGICKLFQKHHASRYASILCEVDHITTQLAGLEMYRTGTIANGAATCDFRYRRKSIR